MIKSGHRAPGRGYSTFKGPESGPKVLEHKRAGQSPWGGVRKRCTEDEAGEAGGVLQTVRDSILSYVRGNIGGLYSRRSGNGKEQQPRVRTMGEKLLELSVCYLDFGLTLAVARDLTSLSLSVSAHGGMEAAVHQ